jgi:hypothetical protein
MNKLLILLLIPSLTLAQVTSVKKGEAAPYDGYLFTVEAEAKNRKLLLDLDVYKALDESNRRIIDLKTRETLILTEQYNIWKSQSDSLSKQVIEANDKSFWRSLLYFGIGVVTTTAIVYGVNKASR